MSPRDVLLTALLVFVLLIAFLVLSSRAATATSVPKDFGRSVHFVYIGRDGGDQASKAGERRFLLALFYLMDALNIEGKDAPNVIVIFTDEPTAEFVGVPKRPGALLSSDTSKPDGMYELWLRGDVTDEKAMISLGRILQMRYGLDREKMLRAVNTALLRLRAEIDVQDLLRRKK